MIFSAEMTWVPAKAPHEFLSEKEGKKKLVALQRKLLKDVSKYGLLLTAKLDPFHRPFQDDASYCIEVVPMTSYFWESSWMDTDDKDYTLFKNGIERLFEVCAELDLTPLPITRKGGKEIHHPSGGCHIHLQSDMFTAGADFYRNMERFHKNLVVDFTNRPYIRWLFAQWFDNLNSTIIFNEAQLREMTRKDLTRDKAFEYSFYSRYAIEPRFMRSLKTTYNTFEIRFINMVTSYDELKTVVTTLESWFCTVKRMSIRDEDPEPTITVSSFKEFKDLRKAKKLCQNWIDEIGLSWDDTYEKLWVRNYRNRILAGKLL